MPILLEIRRKLTFAYGCIFAARSHDQKYIHVKNTYMQMQIYTWSEQVYIYTGVYGPFSKYVPIQKTLILERQLILILPKPSRL